MRRARLTGVGGGFIAIVLGAWGALVPFIGPYFNFGFSPDTTWHVTTDRIWLCALPGAVAVIGGAMLIGARSRRTGMAGGWLTLAAGAWFVVGPAVSLLWSGSTTPLPIGQPLGGADRAALELLASFYALGVLISLAGIASMARYATLTRVPQDATADAVQRPATPLGTGELVV